MTAAVVVFVDLDGTIMVNPFERAVWPALLGEIASKAAQPLTVVRAAVEAEYETRQSDPSYPPLRAMDWDDIAQTVAARWGVTVEGRADALVRQHAASHSNTLPGAEAALRDLAAVHRALVVATKGLAKYQQPVLDALGLTALFSAVLTPDSHNGLKRDRRFFGQWPEQTRLQIMVGDRYDDDVLYPASHGFRTIWIPPVESVPANLRGKDPFTRALMFPYADDQTASADALLLDLSELPGAVRRLEMSVLGFSDR